MFTKQTIKDIDLRGKTVFLRADYNVPVEDGKITDDYRIKQSLPTVQYLLSQDIKLIICSHLGRPEGYDASLSLAPVAKRLGQLLDRPVEFVPDCVGEAVEQAAAAGQFGPGQMTYAGWAPVPPNPYPGMVPPGWHPDPSGQQEWRWWDGTRWTDHTWSEPPPPPAPAADPLVT